MADSMPMIARCMQHHSDASRVLEFDFTASAHSERECENLSHMTEHGPNLWLWTGRQHKLVLMLK